MAGRVKESDTRGVFGRLLRDCLRFRVPVAMLVASLTIVGAGELYLTWMVKVWAEEVVAGSDPAASTKLLAIAVSVTLVTVVAVFAAHYLINRINQQLIEDLRNRVHDRLLSLRLRSVRGIARGDLLSRLFNDVGELNGFVHNVFQRLLGRGVVLVGATAVMFYLDWRLALGTFLVFPLVALILASLGKGIRRIASSARGRLGDLSAVVEEQVHGATTIKSFQTEIQEQQRFRDRNADYRREVVASQVWASAQLSAVWLISGVGLIGILAVGSYEMLAGHLTPGGMVAFCLYAIQTIEPLRHISNVHALMQGSIAAAARFYEIIDLDDVEVDTAKRRVAGPFPGRLRVEDVHFQYEPGKPVLRGVSLDLEPGQTVALAAASGGGKSTLASLLVRFFEPEAGRMTLDGFELTDLPLAELRRHVCVVEQSSFVFSGTLEENVRYGSPAASAQDVRAAIELAGLASMVTRQPGGLRMRIDEGGHNLSAGQRQRIALARAIVRDPVVIVLDEATSAVDSETEEAIFTRLEPWLRKRSSLVMTHRFSTIRRFATIAVLEEGRVVAVGPLAEIASSCPAIERLFGDQLAGAEWIAEPVPTLAVVSK